MVQITLKEAVEALRLRKLRQAEPSAVEAAQRETASKQPHRATVKNYKQVQILGVLSP